MVTHTPYEPKAKEFADMKVIGKEKVGRYPRKLDDDTCKAIELVIHLADKLTKKQIVERVNYSSQTVARYLKILVKAKRIRSVPNLLDMRGGYWKGMNAELAHKIELEAKPSVNPRVEAGD